MEKRLAFKFYSSYYDVAQELNDNERLAFYDALMKRQFSGIETELKGMAKFAYISQKHSIDKQIEGWESKMKTSLNQQINEPLQGGAQGGIKDPSQQEKEKDKEKEEVQEKEKEEDNTKPTAFSLYRSLISIGAESKLANEWIAVRKKKKLANTETAFEGFVREMAKGGLTINETLRICVEKSWGGLNAKWLENEKPKQESTPTRRNPNLTMF